MEIWFSSDLHLGHENIIKYQNRPFANAREMDEALLTYHNERVKPSDHWYNLGDVTMNRGGKGSPQAQWFIDEIRKYNGHKRLLMGNHDHFLPEVYLWAGFEKIYGTWRGIDRSILLSHIPVHPDSLSNVRANVHGHIHGNAASAPLIIKKEGGGKIIKPYINISVEVTNYHPVTLEDLRVMIRKANGDYNE